MTEPALTHLASADRVLARLIKSVGPCDLSLHPAKRRGAQGPFAALVEAVVYQQLTGKAAGAILKRVKALYPGRSFPSPQLLLETPDETLRAAGLPRAKVAAVKDIAAKTLDRTVPTAGEINRMTDLEVIERLTIIRGVGQWTVEMLLIFTLGRPDVLPATDYGVRKGFAATYDRKELPSPKELLSHGEIWRPYRSVAAWYLWRAANLKIDF